MDIEEFLTKNPLYDVYDLEMHKIDGKYDENALKVLHNCIHDCTLPVFQAA